MTEGEAEPLSPGPHRVESDAQGGRSSDGPRAVPMGSGELALALAMGGTRASRALLERLGLADDADDPRIRRSAASSLAARGLVEGTPAGRLIPRGAALAAAHFGARGSRAVALARILAGRELGPALLVVAAGGALILEPGPLGSYLVAALEGDRTPAAAVERLIRLHLERGDGAVAALESRALGAPDPARRDLEVAIRAVGADRIEVARSAADADEAAARHRVATMPLERLGGLVAPLVAPAPSSASDRDGRGGARR